MAIIYGIIYMVMGDKSINIDKKFKIQEFEDDRSDFSKYGLDIVKFVARKHKERPDMLLDFYDFAGEYYKWPEHFSIGDDIVYKKKQYAGEIPAEIILAYAYNYLGLNSPIAYPFFMSTYSPLGSVGCFTPDGVITKDVKQIFPTAVKRGDEACHTITGLYTSEECDNITREGKLSRIKETIASIAFNNKDAGFDNSYWLRDEKTGLYTGVISIDHGYSGRDSMYGSDRDSVIAGLYHRGEHGYNGMYDIEEDRATTLYFLKRLLAGTAISGVLLKDDEIIELLDFIYKISKLDFVDIADNFKDRYNYKCSPKFIRSLEWSREDLCKELGN